MLEEKLTIEDLILCLSSIKPIDDSIDPPVLERSDYNLIISFGRQIVRKIGFTDRQYELAKRKVDDYADYFTFINDLESVKNKVGIPLRKIDRSRWIRIVNDQGSDKLYLSDDAPFIAVRFIFNKKLISEVDAIKCGIENHSYNSESKTHYFPYSEKNLFKIVELFKDKDFKLDDTVKAHYEIIKSFKEKDHVPGVYDYQIKNISKVGIKAITKELGEPTVENLSLYKDRSIKYGIRHFDSNNLSTSLNSLSVLSSKIAQRSNNMIRIISKEHNISSLVNSLYELNRFPILFVLPVSSAYDTIVEFHNQFKNIVPLEQVSVMFRMENQGNGIAFNQFIKDEKINNRLDINTKIVYTLENKVPKPLIKSDWSPESIVIAGNNKSIPNVRKVLDCFDKDLIIFFEEHEGQSTRYFFDRNLETV